MLPDERRMAIFDYVKKNMSATTDELSNAFGVSASTVRRDLEFLASKNLIKRTHKGAVINSPHAESSFLVNYNYMREEKKLIAKKAITYINSGDFIALSGGTTSYFLADEIINSELTDLTILTHSINIAMLMLESKKEFNLILAGGVPRKGSYECVGDLTISVFKLFNIDKYFMGVNGISIKGGISFDSYEEAAVARETLKSCRSVYVIADNSKFGIVCPSKVADVNEVDYIITDGNISKEVMMTFTKAGANIKT